MANQANNPGDGRRALPTIDGPIDARTSGFDSKDGRNPERNGAKGDLPTHGEKASDHASPSSSSTGKRAAGYQDLDFGNTIGGSGSVPSAGPSETDRHSGYVRSEAERGINVVPNVGLVQAITPGGFAGVPKPLKSAPKSNVSDEETE